MKFIVLVFAVICLVKAQYAGQQTSPLAMLGQELEATLQQAKQVIAGAQSFTQKQSARGQPPESVQELTEEVSGVLAELRGTLAEFQAEMPFVVPQKTPENVALEQMRKLSEQINKTLQQVKMTLSEVKQALNQLKQEKKSQSQAQTQQLLKAQQFYPMPNMSYPYYYSEYNYDMMNDMLEYQQEIAEVAYERAMYQAYLDSFNKQTTYLKQEALLDAQEEKMEAVSEQREIRKELAESRNEIRQDKIEAVNEVKNEMREARQEAISEMVGEGPVLKAAKQHSFIGEICKVSLAVVVLGIAIIIVAKKTQHSRKSNKQRLVVKKFIPDQYTQLNI